MPPTSGPLPNGTSWLLNPQDATIIIDACQVDSLGNKERQANVWLEQLPAVLVVDRCTGFAYAVREGEAKGMELFVACCLLLERITTLCSI